MKYKRLLLLLTILFILPLKVNAEPIQIKGDLYTEEQLNLLERTTYVINNDLKNEIVLIDSVYYLRENVGKIVITGFEAWYASTTARHFRLGVYDIKGYDLDPNIRLNMASNYLDYLPSSTLGVINGFAYYNGVSTTTPTLYITMLEYNGDLQAFKDYLYENNLYIYYELEETRLTPLPFYDPNPPEPCPECPEIETTYTYLLIPTFIIIGVVGFIVIRRFNYE